MYLDFRFFFDFSLTYVGAGMICSHLVNLSTLFGAILSWGILWPLISKQKGNWYPANVPESSMTSLFGYKVCLSIYRSFKSDYYAAHPENPSPPSMPLGIPKGRTLLLGYFQPFSIQFSIYVLSTIFYYLPPKDSSPYNSFSPTITPISIPPIYYHSLTNYLFNIFEF